MVRVYILGFYTESGLRYKEVRGADKKLKGIVETDTSQKGHIAHIGMLLEGDSENGRLIRIAHLSNTDTPLDAMMQGLGTAFDYQVSGWETKEVMQEDASVIGTLKLSRDGKTHFGTSKIKTKNLPLLYGEHLAGVVHAFFDGLKEADRTPYEVVTTYDRLNPVELYAPLRLVQGQEGIYAVICNVDETSVDFSLDFLKGGSQEQLSKDRTANSVNFTDVLGDQAKKGEVIVVAKNVNLSNLLRNP